MRVIVRKVVLRCVQCAQVKVGDEGRATQGKGSVTYIIFTSFLSPLHLFFTPSLNIHSCSPFSMSHSRPQTTQGLGKVREYKVCTNGKEDEDV